MPLCPARRGGCVVVCLGGRCVSRLEAGAAPAAVRVVAALLLLLFFGVCFFQYELYKTKVKALHCAVSVFLARVIEEDNDISNI